MAMRSPAGFISAFYDPLKNPNAPTIGTATGGNTSASVTFTAPSNVGGSVISSYTAISTPDGITASAASSPISVTGLTNGTAYTFAVWATNTYGPSAFSAASNSVTPAVPTFIANLYNGTGVSTVTDSSSNIYVLGYRASVNYVQIAKYNVSGVLQWQKEFDFSISSLNKIRLDNSGNILITLANSSQIRVIKLTSAGEITWQKNISGWPSGCSGVQIGQSGICSDSSGNVYVSAPVYANCLYGYSVIKLNSSGTVQWGRFLQNNLGSGSNGVSIAADTSGNVYAVGRASIGGSGKAYLVKYDTGGTLQWQRAITGGGGSNNDFDGVAIDSSGDIYVSGSYNDGSQDKIVTAKYNSSGTLQWTRTLYSGNATIGAGVAVDSSGNSYVTGHYLFSYIMVMAKYNSSGTLQWQRQLTSSSSRKSFGYDVSVDANGNPVFVGYNSDSSNTDTRFFIVKLPPDGSKTGTYTLSGTTWTYQASTLTAESQTPTEYTSGPTSSSVGLSSSNSSATINNSSLSTGTTNLV